MHFETFWCSFGRPLAIGRYEDERQIKWKSPFPQT